MKAAAVVLSILSALGCSGAPPDPATGARAAVYDLCVEPVFGALPRLRMQSTSEEIGQHFAVAVAADGLTQLPAPSGVSKLSVEAVDGWIRRIRMSVPNEPWVATILLSQYNGPSTGDCAQRCTWHQGEGTRYSWDVILDRSGPSAEIVIEDYTMKR